MKVDYYKFECRIPYRLGGEVHGTLKEAKSAYLELLNQGYIGLGVTSTVA